MLIGMLCVCVDQECEEKPCFCLPGRVGPVCLKTNPADVIFAKCKLRDSLDFKASVALIFIALNLDKSITFPSLLSFYLKFFFSWRQINNVKIDKTWLTKRKSAWDLQQRPLMWVLCRKCSCLDSIATKDYFDHSSNNCLWDASSLYPFSKTMTTRSGC